MSISVAQVISATGTPSFVKNASVKDDGDYDVRSKESTYISFVKALVKGASASEMETCVAHAKFWGIEEECKAVQAKYAALIAPPELKDSDYALTFEFNGQKIRKFASCDGPTTVEAAIHFYDQRANFPFEQRSAAAERLLSKAAAFNVELPAYINTYLQKAAAFGAFDPKGLEDAMISREQASKPEMSEEFAKVATVLESMIEFERLRTDYDFIKGAMATIDAYDAEAGFKGGLIEEAIADQLLVSELQKVASETNFSVKLVNGFECDVRDLKKEALAAINPDLKHETHEKLAAILPTLPRDDADLLTQLAS